MSKLLSKETLLSLREVVSLKQQTQRSKKALLSLPSLARYLKDVLLAAPYLLAIYLMIGFIDLQQRVFPADENAIIFSSLITLGLVIYGNALVYIEVHNTLTTGERIETPWKHATKRLPWLIGAVFLSSLIIILGLFMFVIPGVYFALRLMLAAPAAVLSSESVRGTMYESLNATDGQLTMLYTMTSAIGAVLFPLVLGITFLSGWAQLLCAFLLLGPAPILVQGGLAVLYMNGTDDGISIY